MYVYIDIWMCIRIISVFVDDNNKFIGFCVYSM